MTRYTLQRPVKAGKDKSGREMVGPVEEVELRHPSGRVFVELEKQGAFKPGHELELTLGLARAIVVDPGGLFKVDDLWIGDIKGIVKAAEVAGFFPSEEESEPSRMDTLEERLRALESRLEP